MANISGQSAQHTRSKKQTQIKAENTKPSFINNAVQANQLNELAAELCSQTPDKLKLKKLCSNCQIAYSNDLVELMSTVLFELSESTSKPFQKA